MDKRYEPKSVEDKIYKAWLESDLFNPDKLPGKRKKPFAIVLPPPNVTGTLHMGHAIMIAVQEILIRYKRMRGFKTLWLPGTDHAAIATQEKVEKILYKKEKKTRHDLGREKFLKLVEEFAKDSHDTIVNQIKKMGASLDWSREAYTLDKKRNLAVTTAFREMYDAGLIYKGTRIVNWDPKMQTTVSDDEVEWVEEKTNFYYLKYGPFVIGTARPETKFGDKYVVVHPDDKRYKKYKHGQELEVEWINGKIKAKIIKDKTVDVGFGTGAMTITPWHDSADFDIAKRHKLDREQIIDFHGKLLEIAGEFRGEHILKAREKIAAKLEKKGLVEKIDDNYIHRVAKNKRGGGILEPQVMLQWFVDVNKKFKLKKSKIKGIKSGSKTTLKEIMKKTVKSGQIKIIPKRFEKIYFNWIDNLKDWCISRQIWYGHRIPVWYHESKCVPIQGREDEVERCKEIIISSEKPKCEHCNAEFAQDTDTLDTWFSSGIWTFSILGWPKKTDDLATYHPTSVLETGYDIIFFWIARMILMSGFLLGDVPFKTVYLHGLFLDEKGKKMSKSLGNTIDPLDMIEKYGSDAVRMSLVVGNAPGSDLKLSEDKIRGYRNFATKLWNIARFIEMNSIKGHKIGKIAVRDKKRIQEFENIKKQVTNYIKQFKFHRAAYNLYHYIWHTFADKIIEESKLRLQESKESQEETLNMLKTIYFGCLKLLHPFMPFVTEEIYQNLYLSQGKQKFIMIEEW